MRARERQGCLQPSEIVYLLPSLICSAHFVGVFYADAEENIILERTLDKMLPLLAPAANHDAIFHLTLLHYLRRAARERQKFFHKTPPEIYWL
jgi:hypothetical protein